MKVLFGHPTGGPFSFNAALSHYENGRLGAFCLPWMPSPSALRFMQSIPPLRPMAKRFSRRYFAPLARAPKIEGQAGEAWRLLRRAFGNGSEGIAYEANDWLMRTMREACRRADITAVHAYEDCSLWQFREAKRLSKLCIYDMPIAYYPAWQEIEARLSSDYAVWLPEAGISSSRFVRPEQKREEMELADIILVPCRFAEESIRRFHPHKRIERATYGVDLEFWRPHEAKRVGGLLRFIYVGQLSIRKGIPLLLKAWKMAGLKDAELELIGQWQLSEKKYAELPANVLHRGPCASEELRARYQAADVFVFPSFFEGYGLVLTEAMACGLPAIATDATAGPDVMTEASGQVIPADDLDALVASLCWFSSHADRIAVMGKAARAEAEKVTWRAYRDSVNAAVASIY